MKLRQDESGQVILLVLGLALLAFAVAGLAIDGTRAMLYRRTLQNTADAAALAGANVIDPDTYYASGGARIELDVDEATAAAAESVSHRGVNASMLIEGRSQGIAVTLVGGVKTTFLRLIGVETLPVSATARAAPIPGL